MSRRDRKADMRNQVIKIAILIALVAMSLLGVIEALVSQTWWLALLFSLVIVQTIYQLDRATEGYLFLKMLAKK